MNAYYDTLAERTSLARPFFGALTLHVAMFGLTLAYSWSLARQVRLGDPNATPGGAVPINLVRQIPLAPAQTVFENPVAAESRSAVPPPPIEKAAPKAAEKTAEPAAEAIPIPGSKTLKKTERKAPARRFRPYVPDRDNQLYSVQPMGVNTPQYTGPQPDAFGVGIGTGAGGPLGARHGWYTQALQRRISEEWQRELLQVDRRVSTSARTVVFFEILRDGTLRNIRVSQSSGVSQVDYAAMRAVTNANPAPPLPSDLGRNSISIEVWFQLKR